MELEPLAMEQLRPETVASVLVRCEQCRVLLPMRDAYPIVFQGRRFRFHGWTCDRWCAEVAAASPPKSSGLPIDDGPWRVMSATVEPPAAAGPAKPTP